MIGKRNKMELTQILMNGLLLFIVYDSLLWACYLARHSRWLKKHPSAQGYCHRISYRMLFTASIFTGLFLLGLSIFWIWVKVNLGYNPYCYFVVISVHVSSIHLMALLAHCTSLDRCYWPLFSRFVSEVLVEPIKLKYNLV